MTSEAVYCTLYISHVLVLTAQDEKTRLEEAISRLETGEMGVVSEEDDRMAAIRQHFQADRDRLAKIKALQVRWGCGHKIGVGVASIREYTWLLSATPLP